MDEIVKQAMARWPNVPFCYGWLALDGRGAWRMRDEAAQQADALGDRLSNAALVGFIDRNYAADDGGRWYFQNGPQRVYVNLETAPFVARTDPVHGLVVHTGEPFGAPDAACMLDDGALVLQAGGRVAQLDDRDLAQVLQAIELDGKPVTDEALLAWLAGGGTGLVLRWQGRAVAIERATAAALPERFGFVRRPDGAQPA